MRRLQGLDWVRGLAAIWVLLYHVDITLQKEKYFGFEPLSLFTMVGYRGVELFFLLSGFVMARTYEGISTRNWRIALAFAVRRVLRILPAYFVVFVPLYILAAFTGLGAPPFVTVDGFLFIQNLLLLPRDDLTTFIPVSAWTLTHEIMFYCLFLFAFFSWRLFLVIMFIWALVGIFCSVIGIHPDGWRMMTSAVNAYFLLGIACAHLVKSSDRGWVLSAIVAILITLFVAMELESGKFGANRMIFYSSQIAYASSFLLIVWSFAHEDLRLPWKLAHAASYLGRISYGLYLVNYPLVIAVALICKRLELCTNVTAFVFIVATALSVLFADLIHRFVEKPSIEFGKKCFGNKS